jgi:hypothetical protein
VRVALHVEVVNVHKDSKPACVIGHRSSVIEQGDRISHSALVLYLFFPCRAILVSSPGNAPAQTPSCKSIIHHRTRNRAPSSCSLFVIGHQDERRDRASFSSCCCVFFFCPSPSLQPAMSFPSPLKNRSSNADAETSPAVPPMWSSPAPTSPNRRATTIPTPAPTSSSKENVRPAEEDTGAVVVIMVAAAAATATAKPDADASPTKMTPKNEPIKEEEDKPTAGVVVIGAAGATAKAKAKPTADELFPGVMEIVNGNIQEGRRTPKEQYNAAQTVAPTPSENREAIIGIQERLDNHFKIFASYEKRIAKLEAANKALQATGEALQALAAPPVKKRKTTEAGALESASEPFG